jgi:site-specific DNA-methyltransferase (adenine-specific)
MVNLINADCIDVMATFKDKQFDLAIVDPPYGIGEASGQETSRNQSKGRANTPIKYIKKDWDKQKPTYEYWKELKRVSKNQIVWGGNYFVENLTNSSCWLVWDKDNSGDFADSELAWTSFKTAVRNFKYRWNGMIQQNMKNKEVRIHPTQKPKALYEWLLINYAKNGDKILDTHLGSGSIAIACHDLGYDLTGIELDKDYYDAAVKRYNQHKAQLKIW